MPLRMFWSAVRHLDSVVAWQDLRRLDLSLVAMSAQGKGEEWRRIREGLAEAAGTIMAPEAPASSPQEIMQFVQKGGA